MDSAPLRSWHLGLFVFLALIPCVSGQIGWYDAGEFGAAAAGLGVAHPTGFPLLAILGYSAQLLPFGSLPFKLALLCAAALAVTTALIHATVVQVGGRPWPAAIGALFYPGVEVVWLHGTVLEIYALNTCLIACLAWLLCAPTPRWRTAALVTGLGLGAHATFVLIAALLWGVRLSQRRAWRRLLRWLPWGLWGALIIAYLPVAASREPWLDWGSADTLEGLWAHLTASGIRDSFAEEIGVLGADTHVAIEAWLTNAAGERWVLMLSCVVLSGWWVRPRWLWGIALAALALDGAFSVFLNPMGQSDLQTGVPGAWALGLGLALAAGDNGLSLWWRRLSAAVVGGLVLATTSAWAFGPPQEEGLSSRVGHALLMEPGPGGVALLSSDHLAGLALYFQGMEGMRPDVVSLVIQHLPDREDVVHRYRGSMAPVPEPFLATPRAEQLDAVLALTRHELTRTSVFWELGDGRFDPTLAKALRPQGVLYRLAPSLEEAQAPLGALSAPGATLAQALALGGEMGVRSRRVLSDLSRHRGVWHLLRGETAPGARCLEQALALDATNPRALLNLAAARRREGRLDEAIELLERTLRMAPAYTKAKENLERYRAQSASP